MKNQEGKGKGFFEQLLGRLRLDDGGGPQPPDPKKKQMRFSIWYFLLALFLMTLLHDLYLSTQVETLPYSQFKSLVREDKVSQLVVETERIRGTHKQTDGTERFFVTVRVDDPELVTLLEDKRIQFAGKIENRWLPTLLSWLMSASRSATWPASTRPRASSKRLWSS
jgi:cell division protease FtsH